MNRQSSISILKRIIQQNKGPSYPSSSSSSSTLLRNHQQLRNQLQQNKQKISKKLQCQFNILEQSSDNQDDLKIQSRVIKEVDCLSIQSRLENNPNNLKQFSRQAVELPLCLQSLIKTNKLKVRSSIDGMEKSKPSQNSKQEISLPISDLILSDNGYLRFSKQSAQLNEHQNYENQLTILEKEYFQNLRTLKSQTQQKIVITERSLDFAKNQESIMLIRANIQDLENQIFSMKLAIDKTTSQYCEIQNSDRFNTPQLRKVKSLKEYLVDKIANPYQKQQNKLEFRINCQKQKIKKDKEKSVKMMQKLSKAKSNYKKLQKIQTRLNQWEQQIQNNISKPFNNSKPKIKNQKTHKQKELLTPKQSINSPRFGSKPKHLNYLQEEKVKYFNIMKKHISLIFEQMETYKLYQINRVEQLKQQIDLIKSQINYLDTKCVQKFLFTSPQKMKKPSSRSKPKKSDFQNNHSERLIRPSSTFSAHDDTVLLTPRSPFITKKYIKLDPNFPQLIPRTIRMQSPQQLMSRSPKLNSRSPCHHRKSSNQFPRSMNYSSSKSIKPCSKQIGSKFQDITNMSGKSTNYSHSKIKKTEKSNGQVISAKNYNQNTRLRSKENSNNQQDRVEKYAIGAKNKQYTNGNSLKIEANKISMKNFPNFISKGYQMRTEPSDDYCIHSEASLRS